MDFGKIFIAGRWTEPASKDWIVVENPATREEIARVPACSSEDVDRAVKAASAAFPAWAAMPLEGRMALMERFLEQFRALEPQLVDITVRELGSPVAFTTKSQVEYQYVRTRSYIDLAPTVPMFEKMAASSVYREPVGVVGCITPWNYPLGQVIQKIVPALLMGNTVVLKPSQHTPLSSYYLTEAIERAGFPEGVFNLVTGRGSEIGTALSTHPLVAMVSFTGSTSGGITVATNALRSVKRVSLELGGKSPYIILPGLKNWDEPIHILFNSIFLNSGQTCTAFSRLLVPRSEASAIERRLAEISREYTVGDPRDPAVKLGPVSSERQFRKIRSYIEKGIEEGAKLLVGGVPSEPGPKEGWYVHPVIFTGVSNKMTIARDEIFGPVLCVIAYDSVEEAVAIANDTTYGLNAGVYGEKSLALKVARRIEAGNVYVNSSPRDTSAPFGGFKASGIGREGGVYGMLEFTQQKALFDTKL